MSSGVMLEKFDGIGLSGPVGALVFNDKGLEWKGENTATKLVQSKDIARASWEAFGKYGHLRLFLRNGKTFRYDGFSKSQFERIKEILGGYSLDLEKEDLHPGGVNYGDMVFGDDNLVMQVVDETGNEPATRKVLELPLKSVSQCVLPGNQVKNEVELQFVETDTADRDEDTLVEIRFYIPPGAEDDEVPGAEKFKQQILERANVQQQKTGEAILTFSEQDGMFLSPRGRYEINLYRQLFRIHGPKYDHKMAYEDVNNFFLLERPESTGRSSSAGKAYFFVISLKRPIHQGQQRYSYLVLQTSDAASDIEIKMAPEELKRVYEDKLEPTMTGQMHMLIARTFRDISGKKVFTSKKFQSANGANGIKCNLKTAEGFLYPLDKAFMFVPKPTHYIPFKEVETVSFERVPTGNLGGTRAFDLKVLHKPANGDTVKEYLFSDIPKNEFDKLVDYLQDKKDLKVKVAKPVNQAKISDILDEDEGDEEQQGGEDEDDDEEDDEDYQGGSGDDDSGGSGGESDDDSSSGAESVQEDLTEYGAGKKGKKKAGKKEKDEAEGGEGGGEGGDEDEGAGSPAAKKKSKKRKAADGDGEDGEGAGEDGGGKKKKGKKKRKKKDPNAPKRALSAYFFFTNEQRDSVKAENPGIKITEISKLLGEKWKAMSDDDKKVYVDKANEDKERYKTEQAEYLKNKPPDEAAGDDDEEEKPDDSDEEDSD